MKIAVVGCGAVGSYYGAKLAAAGHAVHFLLRSDYEVVRTAGVRILSPAGNLRVFPYAARSAEEIGRSDLVLVALKAIANSVLPEWIPPLVGPETAVLTLQNGLGNEEELAKVIEADQVLGGLCFVCLNRLEPGLVRHMAHGRVVIGEYQGPAKARTHQMAEAFQEAGVPCEATDDLERSRWEKLVWNIPFNGLGVAGSVGYDAVLSGRLPDSRPGQDTCLSTEELLGDPRWEGLVRELMAEVIAVARARGVSIPDDVAVKQIERTYEMGAYKASTVVDFEKGRPLELEHLFLRPLRAAHQAGVSVPRLSALCSVLERLP